MKLFLVFLGAVIYVESQSIVPALYVTPIVTYRSDKRDTTNQQFKRGNVQKVKLSSNNENATKRVPLFYVTPIVNVEKQDQKLQAKRKNRQVIPPSTNYGVPLIPQALPSIEQATSFASNSQTNHVTRRKGNKKPIPQYLPPSTSYGVPLLSQNTASASSESEESKEEAQPQQQYLPPSTSYGVPILPQSQSTTSIQTEAPEEEGEEEEQTTPLETEEETGYNYPRPAEEEEEIVFNKNIYFYKAPKDFEVVPTIKPIKLPKRQKNYKVIFIKAPSVPVPQPVVQLAPQNEDKTLVYVLVKKPEEQPDFVIPTPEPIQPSKPEVYFVKYGTKKERVETAEKTYGVPQYGKGYYYGAGNGEGDSGDENVENAGDDEAETNTTPAAIEESANKSKRENRRQNGKNKNVKQKRGSSRSVRSSSFIEPLVRNDLLQSNRYFFSFKQRSNVYE